MYEKKKRVKNSCRTEHLDTYKANVTDEHRRERALLIRTPLRLLPCRKCFKTYLKGKSEQS